MMMTSGVSPIDAVREQTKTEVILDKFQCKQDYILPNQGPTVLPLAGRAGSPLKLAAQDQQRVDTASRRHLLENIPHGFTQFRPNQYKETLPLKLDTQRKSGVSQPPSRASFCQAPLVKQTIDHVNRQGGSGSQKFKPSIANHSTSTMSHWRAVQGLDNSEEKAERIIKD